MATLVVLGSGIMATALATPFTDNGHAVRLVGTHLDRPIIDSIQSTGVHPNLNLKVPDGVTAYQLEDAAKAFEGAELVMSGVNSFGVDWAGEQLASLLRPGMHLLALAKGMQADDDGNLTILPRAMDEKDPQYVNFNYGAALFGQAAVEMTEFMDLLGGRPSTVLGLPGIGDCFVTSMGGRNVKVGRLVGAGLTFSEAKGQMPGVTLEGAAAIKVIGDAFVRLTERGVLQADQFPLLRHLHDVVANDQAVNVPWKSFFGADGSGQS